MSRETRLGQSNDPCRLNTLTRAWGQTIGISTLVFFAYFSFFLSTPDLVSDFDQNSGAFAPEYAHVSRNTSTNCRDFLSAHREKKRKKQNLEPTAQASDHAISQGATEKGSLVALVQLFRPAEHDPGHHSILRARHSLGYTWTTVNSDRSRQWGRELLGPSGEGFLTIQRRSTLWRLSVSVSSYTQYEIRSVSPASSPADKL